MSMSHGRLHIGTSGWNYSHWKWKFYPPDLKPAGWLRHYAGQFDTVEVNYSFYRLPSRQAVVHWVQDLPEHFCLVLKVWRGITHYRKLKDARELLERFFAVADAIPPANRGPLLFQLPPFQGRDPEKLDRFLHDVQAVTSPSRWRLAFEFRNASWLDGEVYAVLDRHGAAVCLHDMHGSATTEPNRAEFIYVRRHGSPALPFGGYSWDEIESDASRIASWLAEGRDVYVYYNNDMEARAIENARQLKEALARRGV
jgi:uncharacterized protein YecE (DUF72 family)